MKEKKNSKTVTKKKKKKKYNEKKNGKSLHPLNLSSSLSFALVNEGVGSKAKEEEGVESGGRCG